MPADFRINDLIDRLAERLAERVETKLNDPSSTIRPRLLPVTEAACYLGRTEDSIRHLIASGRLPVVRSDKRVFLDRQDLDGWIEEHKQ